MVGVVPAKQSSDAAVYSSYPEPGLLPVDSGPEASASGGSSSKAAESLQAIADLRKELQQAQQQAAQEAGHVAQYRSLAQNAEENTSVVQACLFSFSKTCAIHVAFAVFDVNGICA